jgi:hypothetical protein
VKNRLELRTFIFGISGLLFLSYAAGARCADAEPGMQQFVDNEYGYAFQYPETWKLRKLPEGGANKEIRLMLQGPNSSSFMVVVEKSEKTFTKREFESNAGRQALIEQMMQQTIDEVYKRISTNLQAIDMKVGERRDLSNETAAKFYISTLHTLKTGKAIIVAGIHAVPFSKNHIINFVMTSPWDASASKENEILTAVFNSFRLLGEQQERVK